MLHNWRQLFILLNLNIVTFSFKNIDIILFILLTQDCDFDKILY